MPVPKVHGEPVPGRFPRLVPQAQPFHARHRAEGARDRGVNPPRSARAPASSCPDDRGRSRAAQYPTMVSMFNASVLIRRDRGQRNRLAPPGASSVVPPPVWPSRCAHAVIGPGRRPAKGTAGLSPGIQSLPIPVRPPEGTYIDAALCGCRRWIARWCGRIFHRGICWMRLALLREQLMWDLRAPRHQPHWLAGRGSSRLVDIAAGKR